MPAWRGIFLVILVLLGIGFITSPALAGAERAYAGIVLDAKSGKVLYESAADAARYPASVTKVMTLYILFEELKAGRLKLSSRLTVSKHAAAAVPTKLGLKAGSTIKVEDAIKSLVTLSANDMARVIAEAIEGTESAFANRMTRTARALGMSRTTYANASGLPDNRQVTTARDQARLGVAIYEHFPDYYKYFQTRSFTYNGRSYGNHNRLLGSVSGVDGIKTGYIRASGYNLLTAARTDNRHIVVVGFGFDSGASRNAKVTSLVKKYLPKARSGTYLATAVIPKPSGGGYAVALAPPRDPAPTPDFRKDTALVFVVASADTQAVLTPPQPLPPPVEAATVVVGAPEPLMPPTGIEAATQVALASAPAPQPAEQRPIDVVGAWISTTLRLDGETGNFDVPMPPAAIGSAPAPAAGPGTIDLLTSGSVAKAASGTDEGEIGWVVQVGAAPSENGANSLLAAAAEIDEVANMRRYVQRIERNGQVFFRARIAGFGNADAARAACNDLKEKNMSCLAMQG